VECDIRPIAKSKMINYSYNKGYIANFSLRMRETAIFPLPVQNLMSPSCFSTPISWNTRKFR